MFRLVCVLLLCILYIPECFAEILAPDELDSSSLDDREKSEGNLPAHPLTSKISVSLGQGRAHISSGPPSSGIYETKFGNTSFVLFLEKKLELKGNPSAVFVSSELTSSFSTSARRLDTQAVSWLDFYLKLGADWQREIQNGLVLNWAWLTGASYERLQFPMGTVAFKIVPLGSSIRLGRGFVIFENPIFVSANLNGSSPVFASSISKYPERFVDDGPDSHRIGMEKSASLNGWELRFFVDFGFRSVNDGPRESKDPFPHLLALGWARKSRNSQNFLVERTSSGIVTSEDSFKVDQQSWILTFTESL